MNTDATGAHIDAETLAAWADHGLSAEAAAEVELHLSNCGRCQEVLAAFVRSAPVAGAVVIPFWARRPVQWSAAGLAAAAALVAMIWIGRPPAVPTPESTIASAPSRQAVPVPPVPTSQSVPQAATPAPAEVRKETSASAADLRRDKPAPALEGRAAANEVASKKAAIAPPPPPPAAAPVAPPPLPVTVTGAAPAVTPAAAARPAELSQTFALDAISIAPPIEIVAPEPSAGLRAAVGAGRGGGGARAVSQNVVPARWRIVGGVHVERSMDAGATWTALRIEPALTTSLRAGVATSQSNCWLVGREGVVLVTTDGLTFRRVSLPESVQLVSVIATDALRATVTAVDGRMFSTTDGGLTWK